MAYIDWIESYSVGVEAFDNEHKKLVEIINRLHLALLMKEAESVMLSVLKSLVDYTVTHFSHEENNMSTSGYPDYLMHKKEHDDLIGKVLDFKDQIESGKTSISLSIMSFLKDWLMNHILVSDMKYKEFFIKKGVI